MIPSFGVSQPLMSRWVVRITFDTVRERFICILAVGGEGGRGRGEGRGRGRGGGKGGGGGGTYMYMMLTCNSNPFCKLPIFGSNTML